MSNSTLTLSPLFNLIRLVSFSVCGIIVTSKLPVLTLETVSETPLIEIEPFSLISCLYFFSNAKLTFQDLSMILMLLKEF